MPLTRTVVVPDEAALAPLARQLVAVLPPQAFVTLEGDLGAGKTTFVKAVAAAIGIPEGHVFGVATFDTMYQKAPVGKFHFQVCTNISCALRGAAQLLEKVCERTGVKLEPSN